MIGSNLGVTQDFKHLDRQGMNHEQKLITVYTCGRRCTFLRVEGWRGNWTTRADTPTRGLVNSRTRRLAVSWMPPAVALVVLIA